MLFGVPITGESVAFFVLALVIITSGVLLMTFDKVMHMALALAGVFLGVAGVFILLGADFVGVVQVLIYGGAVTILMVFAVMLTEREGHEHDRGAGAVRTGLALIGAAGLAAVILLSVRSTPWPVGATGLRTIHSTVPQIAASLFHYYAIPFELMSVVLTAALVGAVTIARKEE